MRTAAFIAVAIGLFLSCAGTPHDFFIVGSAEQKHELSTLFSFIDIFGPHSEKPDSLKRFMAARRISALLIGEGYPSRSATFLIGLADPPDEYAAWYVFTAAASYEASGETALAIPLYERVIKTLPDMTVDGKSLYYECLERLVKNVDNPDRLIDYYRDLIARFPDSPDIGSFYFLLAKQYEKTGDWNKALEYYTRFLPYFGTTVPGYPDALKYARDIVEFNASPKDWTYENLDDLVAGIRKALIVRSARDLRKFAAKAGFFAVSWYQDTNVDANSRVLFDFSQFMANGPISVASSLDPSSNDREAYLRTSGWTDRAPVWYFYFRRINFPADPEVHGQWEWAGIYFGEKVR
jgi:tetratricopeptide (TPR) repeat protein